MRYKRALRRKGVIRIVWRPGQRSLFDMPELPMKMIMDYCDLPAIQKLSKTCHTLRDYIKTHKPGARPVDIAVEMQPAYSCPHTDELQVRVFFHNPHEPCLDPFRRSTKFSYEKGVRGTRGKWEKRFMPFWGSIRTIRGENVAKDFMRDFMFHMDFSVSRLEHFKFGGGNGLSKAFQEDMKTRELLKIRKITFSNCKQNEILEVLPYTCYDTVEKITIEYCKDDGEKLMSLYELAETDYWKKTRVVELDSGFVKVKTCPVERMVIKEAFLSSNSLTKSFKLDFYDWKDREAIHRFLDPSLKSDIETDRVVYRRPKNPCPVVTIQFKIGLYGLKTFSFNVTDTEVS
ncbi:unnamed protein product [Caenorhabditis brenneri]